MSGEVKMIDNTMEYQKRFGTFHDDIVPKSVLNKKNAAKSWEYGYNKEYDIVIISKDGTLGQVYELDNLKIGLPRQPRPKEIRGYGQAPHKTKWTPFTFPKPLLDIEKEAIEFNSNPANKNNYKTPTEIFFQKPDSFINKYLPIINDDFNRREFGLWQYINGKATYIVGSHYFMLQHSPVQGTKLPDFRFSNLDLYIFFEACKADYRSMGMIKPKGRREGASTMCGSECVNMGTGMEEGFIGIVSKTNRDSTSFLQRMVIRPFRKMPWWVKPDTSGTTSSASGLILSKPATRMSTKYSVMSAEEGLDTTIKAYATALNSMDGEAVDLAIVDECFGSGFEVMMYDGSIKRVEDIVIGDVVMGDDSTPRMVLETYSGTDNMYKVSSKFGEYTCNSKHKIRLNHSHFKESFLTPEEYLELPEHKQRYYQEEISGGELSKISVEPIGVNKYYGFTLDGNNLFLGSNYVIHKNCGKFPAEVPIDSYWSILATALTQGFKIIGKAMLISTVNEMAKGGEGFKDLFFASDVTKRMENERTTTGLYSLFIPADWCMEGGYDIYGYSVVDTPSKPVRSSDGGLITIGNREQIEQQGKAKKKVSTVMYHEHLRQYPLTLNHCFLDPASASDFNLLKIHEQIEYNDSFESKDLYEFGNFINDGTEEKPLIKWIPSYTGRFKIAWMPPEQLRNNFQIKNGEFYPMNDFGVFGLDPYKVEQTVDSRGSMAAMYGLTGKSMDVSVVPSNQFFLEYINRPNMIKTFYNDMVYAMLFYGIPALIERNVDGFVKYLKDIGMTRFSMRRRDVKRLAPEEKTYGGIYMNAQTAQDHYFALQTYIEKYVGVDEEGKFRDVGQMGECPFNNLLTSLTKFSPSNRTSQDASIAGGLAVMGVNMTAYDLKNKIKINPNSVGDLFPEYKY